MRTLVLPLFASPLLACTVFAVDRRLRAVRTRRQTVDALAMVPELAGLAPVGQAQRVGWSAKVLGERLPGRERRRVVTVARLVELDPGVVEAAGLDSDVVHLLREVRGQRGLRQASRV